MSRAEKDIQELLDSELKMCLAGIFCEYECIGRVVARMGKNLTGTTFEVEKDPCGCGRRYTVIIYLEDTVYSLLRGAILVNRSRIESKLLAAIRDLISQERPHWINSIVGKIIIKGK